MIWNRVCINYISRTPIEMRILTVLKYELRDLETKESVLWIFRNEKRRENKNQISSHGFSSVELF